MSFEEANHQQEGDVNGIEPSCLMVNLSDEIKRKHQEYGEYFIASKISSLNENCALKTWKDYFEIAFNLLKIDGSNFQEKIENYIQKYGLIYTSSNETIVYSEEGGIDVLLVLKDVLIKQLKEQGFTILYQAENKVNELLNDRIKDIYGSDAYYVYFSNWDTEFDNTPVMREYIDLMSKVRNGEVPISESLDFIDEKLQPEIEDFVEKYTPYIERLRLFDKELPFYNTPSNQRVLDTELFNAALESGLEFRMRDDTLFAYTKEGMFINTYILPISNEQEVFNGLIYIYGTVRLSEYIQLDIDDEIETTSTYVEDTSHIRQISVPKKYALMLKVYQDKGYAFKVVAISGSQVNIMVLKGGYAVFNIVSNAHNNDRKYDLWLEILLMHLSRHSENDGGDNIEAPELTPEGLLQKKIDFVNEVHDNIFDDIRGNVNPELTVGDLYVGEIIKIGLKHNLPLDQIFLLIPQIYTKIFVRLRDSNIDSFIIDLGHFLPNRMDFLWKYNIPERSFNDIKNAYTAMHFQVWNWLITERPKKALERITELADHYMLRDIHMSEYSVKNKNGITGIIIYIVNRILSADPELYYSQEMSELFRRYDGLKHIIDNGDIDEKLENQETLGVMSGGSFDDFEKASTFGLVRVIRFRIVNDWLNGYELSGRNKLDLKLAIARSLVLQYKDRLSELKKDFNMNGEGLVRSSLERIMRMREILQTREIFGEFDLFHIAHFGQDVGVDYSGTTVTQNALRYQAGERKYTLFDAQNINGEEIWKGERDLSMYINDFINSDTPSMLITEGHGSATAFSVLYSYKSRDKLGINVEGEQSIIITPKELADIIIKRQKLKDKKGINTPDFIMFAACRGDYAINFYNELSERSNELSDNFIPPIMMTAAETGQNSTAMTVNLDTEIPYGIFKHVLGIGKTEKTTYQTYFENQFHKQMQSNPSLFYPIKIGDRRYPQQIG